MSAFIVMPGHIDYLVSAAIALNIGRYTITVNGQRVDLGNATETGRMLYRENVRSVAYRYSHRDDDQLPGPIPTPDPDEYEYRQHRNLDAAQVVKAIACFEYQSCETPDWTSTDAYQLCQQLVHGLLSTMPGYDEAEWEIGERGGISWAMPPTIDWGN